MKIKLLVLVSLVLVGAGCDSTNGHQFVDMFNQVISKIPGHYKCNWSWMSSDLIFHIKW